MLMTRKIAVYLILFLFSFLAAEQVAAQFEGEIRFDVYNPTDPQTERVNLQFTFTADRIFMGSDTSVNMLAGLRSEGILIRNDLRDFVLITSATEGINMKMEEIETLNALVNRMQNQQGNQSREPFDWDQKVTETGNTRQIYGYNTVEYQIVGDEEGETFSVWLTDGIRVNWGMLRDVWYSTGATRFDREIPLEIVMNRTSFPLLIEAHKDQQVVFRAETVHLNDSHFDRSVVEVPGGMKLLGLGDIMMNFFRQ
ncbi:MAG: hypothetical protein EA360_06960 [Balneolaceae bacterium]|nr:MAG: hypothetical protein EA360_06960 [Balneolaceae bacterium]